LRDSCRSCTNHSCDYIIAKTIIKSIAAPRVNSRGFIMEKISEIDQKGIIEALGVEPKDLWEAKYNLLGFFGVLYKIDQRLRQEDKIKNNE
jgi:hypothetical protein